MKTMKQVLLALIFSALVGALYGQRFELRLIDKGERVDVQIRNVSETPLRATTNHVTDLVFGVKWRDTGISFLEMLPGGSYRMVSSGGVKQHNGYYFMAFGGMQTPYLMPRDWKKDTWLDLVVFKVHGGGGMVPKIGPRFSLTESGFHPTTDPNVGIDLVDEIPKIVPYQVADTGVKPYAALEVVELEARKYGPRHGHLTWSVDVPEDVRSYIIERSIGEEGWMELAQLPSEGQFVHVYVDENVFDGISRHQQVGYRVRVQTLDGERISVERVLDFNAQKMIQRVFPNPAADNVSIEMTATETEGEAYLELYNTDAKLVYRNAILPGSVKEQIDLAANNVTSGSYTVHLISGGEILDAHPLHVMR
jgi:hypothetical protein